MKVVEIGDIVATDNGEKMVVDIYRNRVSKVCRHRRFA
jgi:hypothetical protein